MKRFGLVLGAVLLGAGPTLGQDIYSYDADGNTIGLSTIVDGVTLTVRATASGIISAPAMPTLTTRFDSSGRFQSFRGPAGPLVTYVYAVDGSVRRVSLPGGLSLTSTATQGILTQQVSTGALTLAEVQVADEYGHGRWHLLLLDLLKRQLHLADDWFDTVSLTYNATGTAVTVRSHSGALLFYLLRFGQINVGFDSLGHGMFYDIDRTLEVSERATAASGASPTRIVVTRDQRVQVQAPSAPDGAIESFWYDPGAPKARTRASRTVTYTVQTIEAPTVYAFCGSSTVCEGDGRGSGGCVTSPYYCDYDGRGGPRCYDCENDPDPSLEPLFPTGTKR